MESLEELKAIRDGAPEGVAGGQIFINAHGNYVLFHDDDFYMRDEERWAMSIGFLPCYGLRSLSDINRIIELMEKVNDNSDERINQIARNGGDGEHYEKE